MLLLGSPFIICDLYYGFLKCVWLATIQLTHSPNGAFAPQTLLLLTKRLLQRPLLRRWNPRRPR